LGEVNGGVQHTLILTGNLLENKRGASIEGSDCVVIKGVK
jgi:hypothetical protein